MGCQVSLTIATRDVHRADTALEAGRRRIEEIESCLSRFRPESELARLNARSGGWSSVSPLLGTVLGVALRTARRSGGLCTPTILGALEAAGYDRDFSALADPSSTPVRAPASPSQARSTCGGARHVVARGLRAARRPRTFPHSWRAIRLTDNGAGGTRIWVPRGVRLDLAGVAKGWTADRVADLLANVGPCLVDAGGDLAARGAPPGLDGWPVVVADPRHDDRDIALVLNRDGGIATSGIDFRRWVYRGREQHHVIDPRTGEPARTDVLQVTVIAPTAVDADVHAKTALLLRSRGALAYLNRERLAGLIVRQDGCVLTTRRWSDYALPV